MTFVIHFPISWHLRCNQERSVPLDWLKGEILINGLSSAIWNTWIVLETRWMNWYTGNGLHIRRTWLTKGKNVPMIKSIPVYESTHLLQGGVLLNGMYSLTKKTSSHLSLNRNHPSLIYLMMNVKHLMIWQYKSKFTFFFLPSDHLNSFSFNCLV